MKKNEKKAVTAGKKPSNYKRALALAGVSVVSMILYFGMIALSDEIYIYIPIMEIYTILIAILVCASVVVNAGIGKTPPTPEELPQKWDEDKKQKFIASFSKRKKTVKIFSFCTLALVFPLFVDIIHLWLTDLFA